MTATSTPQTTATRSPTETLTSSPSVTATSSDRMTASASQELTATSTQEATTPTDSQGSEGNRISAVVIVAPIAVVILGLSVTAVVCWSRRRRKLNDPKYQSLTGSSGEVSPYGGRAWQWE
jgi:hypothetical protein